jgi:predicted Rossmann fold nucleotide-binding protein DprA/Smf involved in DNA uptake
VIVANSVRLHSGAPGYPAALSQGLPGRSPTEITAMGSLSIFERKVLALFCSVKCPGSIILQAYDLACSLRDSGVTVISGFHSPMERECLNVLLRGTQPIIICPARGVEGMRLSVELKAALSAGRLLLLSPLPDKQRRADEDSARFRNEFVAALADRALIAYAAPGGDTEQLARRIVGWGKPLLTLESEWNAGLVALGALSIEARKLTLEGYRVDRDKGASREASL